MRVLVIWMVVAVLVAVGTAGLLWFSTASSAQFQVDGTRLSVSGQLTLASTERLSTLLEENAGLTTLVLGEVSPESDATSLMQKGFLVRGAGLSTEVAQGTILVGDAVYLFLAGTDRSLNPGAAIIPTDWQTRVGPASQLAEDHPAHEERLDYVSRMLGNTDFYWYSLSRGDGAAGPATQSELADLGVVTTE